MGKSTETIIAGHQPHYLPWIGYFSKAYVADVFCLVDSVQYNKKQFQNRSKILTPNGPIWLTVPVITKSRFYQNAADVEINNNEPWRRKHWKSIKLAYNNAPYFSDYCGFFEEIYGREWKKLVDLSEHMLRGILDILGIKKEILKSSELGTQGKKTDLLIDICQKSGADGYLSGSGGARKYVELEKFKEVGLAHYFLDFTHPVYPQQGAGEFISHMSIIDLLFNCGPKSVLYIKESGKKVL